MRPEDWPVMPCEVVGFQLKPVGFFRCNPTLDVAPSADAHSVRVGVPEAALAAAAAAAAEQQCCSGPKL